VFNASEAPEIAAAGADLDSVGRILQQLLNEGIFFISGVVCGSAATTAAGN
jgi:hypothetical protein